MSLLSHFFPVLSELVDACALAPSLLLSRDCAVPLPGPRCLTLPPTWGGGCAVGSIRCIVPTAFVLPSLKIILVSGLTNSGCFIKRKRTIALSPVLRWSLSMWIIVAVCRMLPQWTENKGNKDNSEIARVKFVLGRSVVEDCVWSSSESDKPHIN